MKILKKLLFFLSNTDKSIYSECSQYAKSQQLTNGVFVLLTGIMAFLSGTYAIMQLFTQYDNSGKSYVSNGDFIISLIVGLFYGTFILFIDRAIVSSFDKKSAWVRLPLAVIIGLVIAFPLEIKIMEGRITKQLFKMELAENNQSYLSRNNELKSIQEKTQLLQQKVFNEENKVAEYMELMRKEAGGFLSSESTGKKGYGPAYQEAKKNKELHEQLLVKARNDLSVYLNEVSVQKEKIETEYKERKIHQQYDLLSKYIALKQLEKEDKTGASRNMSLGITLLIMLLELTPAIMKVMQPVTEYDQNLLARLALMKMKTKVTLDRHMDELEKNPESALEDNGRIEIGQVTLSSI